jgi:hypothetical protein
MSGSGSLPVALSIVGKYPDNPPELPLRSMRSMSLHDLQHWRAEIFSARGDLSSAGAALCAASAAKEAAVAQEEIAVWCVSDTESRYCTAYDNFIKLYSLASLAADPSPGPSSSGRSPVSRAGRVASSGRSDGSGDGKEHVSRELEGSSPEGRMELS